MSMSDTVNRNWNVGKRQKSILIRNDSLLVSMSVLKHDQQWDFVARLFKIATSILERQATEYLQNVCLICFEKYVI